ncbi:MAG: ComEC/Rec2 family competence protein, partial [Synergistes sp.]|nr:ComEC/Rec2 family competence protein [Synergistes sp.]
AVSGLHIWIIAGLFLLLMKNGAVRAIVVSLFIWGYLALLAFPVGGVRAALMVELLLIAAAVGKPSASFNNISIAAVLLLLYNPWYFFDIGWRLSVLSALFISAAVSVIGTGAWQTAGVSVLLWFVTAPVIALSFGEVPLAGLALNIAVIPIFGLIFPLVLVLSLPALIGLPLGAIAAQCAEVILTFFDRFILIGARILPGSLGWDTALYVLSLALFAAFAAARCCGGIKRSLTVAAFFVVFMLYSSAMM